MFPFEYFSRTRKDANRRIKDKKAYILPRPVKTLKKRTRIEFTRSKVFNDQDDDRRCNSFL
jgi:hypothetical protein